MLTPLFALDKVPGRYIAAFVAGGGLSLLLFRRPALPEALSKGVYERPSR